MRLRLPLIQEHIIDLLPSWKRFFIVFITIFFSIILFIFLILILIDPFDSGRFVTVLPPGISDASPRTANVSRGRDQAFSAAIIGNSRIQMVDPKRLDAGLPYRFVQLSVPGTGALEQAAILSWFARHHRHIDALVIGISDQVCQATAPLKTAHPFPFWLYRGNGEYLASLYSTRALDHAGRRLRLAAGWLTPDDRAGYWDYEAGKAWNFAPLQPSWHKLVPQLQPHDDRHLALPGLDHLLASLATLPVATNVIFVHPPAYLFALPHRDTLAGRMLAACKARLLSYQSQRPRTVILDYLIDDQDMRDPENFMDALHMRGRMARRVEADITALLSQIARSP